MRTIDTEGHFGPPMPAPGEEQRQRDREACEELLRSLSTGQDDIGYIWPNGVARLEIALESRLQLSTYGGETPVQHLAANLAHEFAELLKLCLAHDPDCATAVCDVVREHLTTASDDCERELRRSRLRKVLEGNNAQQATN